MSQLADDRLDSILGAYYDAVAAGQRPDPLTWIARHPGHAAELASFFIEQDRLHDLAGPLRAATPEGPMAGPRTVGDYELLEEIARGGMGIVFKARQASLNRIVALKLILTGEFAGPDEVRRFRAEAEAVAQLDHPGIVPVYEVDTDGGRHFFSMKLLEGGNLGDQLDRYAADPRAAASLVATISRAVHHAHQRGILHRDLKPSNVLLDAAGNPFVADFGLARRVLADGELTASGFLAGSPSYMAPEQATSQRGAITTATDVYGLGAILYAALTRRPPLQAGSLAEAIALLGEHEPIRPSRLDPRIDRDLEAICLKCLERNPARRYESAEALANDLTRWLAGEPIAARPIGPIERLWRRGRRKPLVASLSAAVVLLAAAVLLGLPIALVRIERERSEAASARRRAEAHLRGATLSLGEVLMRLQDRTLPDSPALADLRRDISADVLRLYRGFLGPPRGDAGQRLEDGIAHVHLGGIHAIRGDMAEVEAHHEDAIRLFEGLVAEYPGEANYHRELAEARGRLGLHLHEVGRHFQAAAIFREARSSFLRALELAPEDLGVVKGAAWFLARCPDRQLRDLDRAIALGREAVCLAPRDGNVRYRLGAYLALGGDSEAAITAIEESVRLGDGLKSLDSNGLDLATAHLRRGDLRQARHWFDRASAWIDRHAARDFTSLLQRAEVAAMLDHPELFKTK